MTPITKNLKLQKAYSILFLLLPFLAMAQEDFTPDTDDLASNAPIDNYILSYRKIFEADHKEGKFFHSIRGVGYKLTLG